MRPRSPSAPVLVLFLVACGGPAGPVEHANGDGPPPIDAESYQDALRAYTRMDPEDPARLAWRDALTDHVAERSPEIMASGDYDAVIAHLARLTSLLTPADVEARRVPTSVGPVARWVVEHGAPRGDEGRVMAARLLLAGLEESPDAQLREREAIATWGREARAGIENPIERYSDLIQVWEQHDQIAPAPEVSETLSRLYVEQRDALSVLFGQMDELARGGSPGGLTYTQLQLAPHLIARAPLDVAAVYLRHGDLEGAIAHVSQMQPRGGDEQDLARLRQILEAARARNTSGAEALGEIAVAFARARPEVSEALCSLGVRRFPDDARFPLCLARVAIANEQPGLGTAWYAEVVRLAPDQRDVYDEALRQLDEVMQAGVFDDEIGQSRALARSALSILDEHERRWPNEEPAVTRAEILLSLGRAEMSAGHTAEARSRLEASLAAHESREGHLALGLLLERLGQGAESAGHYRTALDLTPSRTAEDRATRAELTEQLGDAFRTSGQEQQARRMYRQALEIWDGLLEGLRGPSRAAPLVRRGILLSRLGDAAASTEAFEAAIEAAPTFREPYATILAHLVVSAPNLPLAQTVLRRAQFQLHLEPEWKVY
ncbi:MAG: tetratricopeptide repeat protein, partial [Myxococcales bacterium]|nr:tetratricopeptide repeat protein [Myxococcales bacterium]